MRWPDNIVWSWRHWFWPRYRKQRYHFDAICWTVVCGPLTLRWHKR